MTTGADAYQPLRRPTVIGAVVVLVANDHLLKRVWPGWVTGKLSDVSGVLVASVCIGVVLRTARASERAARTLGPGATGLVFALAKGDAAIGRTVGTVLRLGVDGPFVADRSDLLALAALPLAHRALRWDAPRRPAASAAGPSARPGIAGRALLALALVACVASSPPDDTPRGVVDLALVGDRLVVGDPPRAVSTDGGVTWRPATAADVAPTPTPAVASDGPPWRIPSGCTPGRGCVVVERDRILENRRVMWEPTAHQREYAGRIARLGQDRPIDYVLGRPVSVPTGRGPQLVVPLAPDRVVVRSPQGLWRVHELPHAEPLAGDLRASWPELPGLIAVVMLGFLTLALVVEASRLGLVILGIVGLGVLGEVVTFASQLVGTWAIAIAGYVVVPWMVAARLRHDAGGVTALLAASASVVGALPVLAWNLGALGSLRVAQVLGYGAAVAAMAAAVGWHRRTVPFRPGGG